ncbi:MAG: hypothetical protein HZC43_11635 [Nitrosomonadales bacterium]|nr:hypothetical protein [Nitrosomonadales bacterium]
MTVIGYSHTDQWGTTVTYDAAGAKTGSSNTWTDTWSGNVVTSYQDANGYFLSSETRNAAGVLLFSNADIYTNGVLTGHTYFNGTTTFTYDANWNLVIDPNADIPPYVTGLALNTDGITINFSENASGPTNPADVALTLSKNGITPMAITGAEGNGTMSMTIHTNQSLASSDWVLLNYNGTTTANGIADAAGNVMLNDAPPGYGGSAEGGSSDSFIDLSNTTTFAATAGYDISGGLGNDTIIGSASHDWIMGGAGADTMTGGVGPDHFSFIQDNSCFISFDNPSGTAGGGSFTFTGGIDIITDFSPSVPGLPPTESSDTFSLKATDSDIPGSMGNVLDLIIAAPSDGLAVDQSFYMVKGNYSVGQFTVNLTTGQDTLVVYDSSASLGITTTSGIVMLNTATGGGGNPPPATSSITYSTPNFSESTTNDGSITGSATITLAGDSFTGAPGTVLSGVTVTGVPDGLTATVMKTTDTTATLSFTGFATMHGAIDSVSGVSVMLGERRLDHEFRDHHADGRQLYRRAGDNIEWRDGDGRPGWTDGYGYEDHRHHRDLDFCRQCGGARSHKQH